MATACRIGSRGEAAGIGRKLGKRRYEREEPALRQSLLEAQYELLRAGQTSVVVFEGMDAAGKGSSIRRVTQALDARSYHVIPVAAPTDEERAQPYLWRFWRHVPHHDKTVIFDRS